MQEIIKRSLGSWQWLCFVTVGARGTEKKGQVLHMGKREKNRKRKEHKNVAQTNISVQYTSYNKLSKHKRNLGWAHITCSLKFHYSIMSWSQSQTSTHCHCHRQQHYSRSLYFVIGKL